MKTRGHFMAAFAGLVLLTTLIVVGVSLFAGSAVASPSSGSGNVAPPPPPQRHQSFPPSQVGLGYMDASKGKLTDGQVVAFLESHRFIGGDVIGGGFPKVSHIKHLTAKDFASAHGVTLMLPDAEELVQVDIEGPFHLNRANAPHGSAAAMAKASIPTIHVLIDVTTGNLEAWNL